jgi:Fe-S-cluster containining protein
VREKKTTATDPVTVKGYTLSPELFRRGFPSGAGPCQCTSECCEGGVYADVRERDAILAHREIVKQEMDETQDQNEALWFETAEHEDPDYPSGRCVGTREINGKCAFLDGQGRCSIQVACANRGMNKWALKPLFCILYPITIEEGVLSFDAMLQGEHGCCSTQSRFAVPLFEGCREELVHLLGEEGYRQVQEHSLSQVQEDNYGHA